MGTLVPIVSTAQGRELPALFCFMSNQLTKGVSIMSKRIVNQIKSIMFHAYFEGVRNKRPMSVIAHRLI